MQEQARTAGRAPPRRRDRAPGRHPDRAEGQFRHRRLADPGRACRGATEPAEHDAHVVARLRASGAVLVGKTNMDEGALGARRPTIRTSAPPTIRYRHGYSAGGSSGGAAAAVAAGLAVAAVGSDSLGSIRIPASYCGVYALKPTHGEISARGMVPAARRLDAVGLLARSVDDLTVLLQVLAGYDADDARSRRRRVAFDLPDWEPGHLRAGLLPDLAAVGVAPEVIDGVRGGAGEAAARAGRASHGGFQRLGFRPHPSRRAAADGGGDAGHLRRRPGRYRAPGIRTVSARCSAMPRARSRGRLRGGRSRARCGHAEDAPAVLPGRRAGAADHAAGRISAGWPGAGFDRRPDQLRQPGRLSGGEPADGHACRTACRSACSWWARAARTCACWSWPRSAPPRWMPSRPIRPSPERTAVMRAGRTCRSVARHHAPWLSRRRHGSRCRCLGPSSASVPGWLDPAEADALLAELLETIPWENHRIRMFGREVASPRLSCWIGDPGTGYTYSRTRFEPRPWPAALGTLAHAGRAGLRGVLQQRAGQSLPRWQRFDGLAQRQRARARRKRR